MLKRRSKHFALLLVLTMLATMFVGVGTASAKSVNSVDKVKAYTDSWSGATATLTIQEDDNFLGHFAGGDTFSLRLPSPVKWNNAAATVPTSILWYPNGAAVGTELVGNTNWVNFVNNQTIDVKIPDGVTDATPAPGGIAGSRDRFEIAASVDMNGVAAGEVALTVDPLDSAITGGKYIIATVGSGKASVAVQTVEKIGKTGNGGVIEIRENAVGAITSGTAAAFTLILPANFEWDTMTAGTNITAGGAFTNALITSVVTSGTTLTFNYTPAAGATQRGVIYVTPAIKASKDAAKGEVTCSVSAVSGSTNVADQDVVVANYSDYGATIKVKEVKELKAGKFGQKTEEITIEENVPGTIITGRDAINVAFPSWVKVTNVSAPTLTSLTAPAGGAVVAFAGNAVNDGTKSNFDINIATGTAGTVNTGKIKFTVELSIEAGKSGDIEAEFSGAGLERTKFVVAKAMVPVSGTAEAAEVKIGLQNQEVKDIVITEAIKEGIKKSVNVKDTTSPVADNIVNVTNDGEIVIGLTEGAKFSATPKVEVIEGNLELKTAEARLINSDTEVSIPVKSESTKPSKIKLSGIKLTIDRAVPEGAIYAKVKGTAVTENYRTSVGYLKGGTAAPATYNSTSLDAGEFDSATQAKVLIANVVTPAPGEVKNDTSFVIGAASYKVNGVEKTMDVAPYIKDSRTYMPIRYVAYALGISDTNILWDGANNTVTLMKGDKVVQLKVGSKSIMINGAAVTMDVAPEISNSRTMLPISFVANAFGATAAWDAATQTVTIK